MDGEIREGEEVVELEAVADEHGHDVPERHRAVCFGQIQSLPQLVPVWLVARAWPDPQDSLSLFSSEGYPSYWRTLSPAFQSLTYISPSGVT